VIVSRCFFPRFCPQCFVKFLSFVLKDCVLIWDFDDNILGTTLTQNEYKFLCNKAGKIIVTQIRLKKMVSPDCVDKVVLLPTTDGDMNNFDCDIITFCRQKPFAFLKTKKGKIWIVLYLVDLILIMKVVNLRESMKNY